MRFARKRINNHAQTYSTPRISIPALTESYQASSISSGKIDRSDRIQSIVPSVFHRDRTGKQVTAKSSPSDWNVDAADNDYVAEITDVVLPNTILDIVETYEQIIGERNRFLWKWIYSLFPAFTLSSVSPKYAETVRVQKTVLTVFITILDDLAEKHGDIETFEEIRRSIVQYGSNVNRSNRNDVVDFAEYIWLEFESGIVDAPNHEDYREVFDFDLRQVLNSIDYSCLLNNNLWMANLYGADHYCPHNMVMFPYMDIDLMYSTTFDPNDIATLREVVWELQKLARIGNWLTTWEREIGEGDYTAGIVIYALTQGIITIDELETLTDQNQEELVRRIKSADIEERFLSEWSTRYRGITANVPEVASVDLTALISGMKIVFDHHLASRGRK